MWRDILHSLLESGRGGFLSARPAEQSLAAADRPIAAHVVVIHGAAGVGKTTLGLRLREVAQKEKDFARRFRTSWLDWAEVARQNRRLRNSASDFDPTAFVEALYSHFVREDRFGTFDDYRAALAQHHAAQARIDQFVGALAAEIRGGAYAGEGAADDLRWLAGLDAAGVAYAVRGLVPLFATTGSLPDPPVSVAPSVTEMGAFDAVLRVRLGRDYMALIEPATSLAQALGADVARIAAEKPLLLSFDSYDAVDRADAVLQKVMAVAGAQCVWVLIGRRDISPLYTMTVQEGRLLPLEVEGLTLMEAAAFLAADGQALNVAMAEQAVAAVGGAPLALGAFGQLLSFEMSVDDVAQALAADDTAGVIARYAEFLVVSGHPDRVALAAVALAPAPDVGLLAAMLDVSADSLDFQAVMERLYARYDYLFVAERSLHPLAADAFRHYLLQPDHRLNDNFPAKRVNRRAAAYLVRRLTAWQQNFQSLRGRVRDARWGEWATALAWHLLWLDEAQAWRLIVALYVAATAYQPALVPRLLDVLDFFADHDSLSADGRGLADALLAAGRLDFADRNRAVAAWVRVGQELQAVGVTGLIALDTLIGGDNPDSPLNDTALLQATVAYQLALAYIYADNGRAAIAAAERALELDPRGLAVPGDALHAVLTEAHR